ncbi:hypothetical protein Q6348_08450 [Isoptericola sp. b441]|uniref:DUF1648 domain-containing protein n=1 Tax=Actinotalea lenta TaxID=3064654 RepID=A0ABT9D8K3_9CELL|nr:hypothetical protein [Isoptericola sp. b441]MDO8107223.1 hypothetical protein [Isoptericola sp. b441]
MPWQGAAIYLASLVGLLAVLLGALAWDALRTVTPSQAASRANRHATLASAIGVVLMVVLVTWTVAGISLGVWPRDGRVLAVLPVLGGAVLLAAQAVGQLTWPRPTGSHREAELVARTVADVSPVGPRRMVLGWAGLALVLLVVFGVVADGPRSLTQWYAGNAAYPGWYYGVPMSLAVLVLVAATELVQRLIMLRPAVPGVSTEWDLRLRRRSAGHVTRGIQLVLAVTVAGTLVAAAWGHVAVGRVHGSVAQTGIGYALLGAAACVSLAGLVLAVVPLPRGQRNAPSPDHAGVSS